MCMTSLALIAALAQEAPVQLRVDVNIGLVGTSAELADDLQDLQRSLAAMMPTRQPACGERGQPMTGTEYVFRYHAVQLPSAPIEDIIGAALRPAADGGGGYELEASHIEERLEVLYTSFLTRGELHPPPPPAPAGHTPVEEDAAALSYAILLLNPDVPRTA